MQALRQTETGTTPVVEICSTLGVTETTCYRWKKQCGGLDTHELCELNQRREENRGLKQVVANLPMGKVILEAAVARTW